MDSADLVTEQLRPELADLDLRSTSELVQLMAADQKEALDAVRQPRPASSPPSKRSIPSSKREAA